MQSTIDKSAIGLSFLCVIHCLVLPVAVTVLPYTILATMADERFHQFLLLAILPTSIIALMLGCRKHKTWNILVWGLIGLCILILAAVFGHELVGEVGEKVLTVLGSAFVIYSHYRNYMCCREQRCHC